MPRRTSAHSLFLLPVGLLAASVAACGAPDPDSEPLGQAEEEVYVDTALPLFNDLFTVPVCFVAPRMLEVEPTVVFTVTEQWGGNSGLTFTGWGACTGDPREVPIKFVEVPDDSQWGGFSAMGRGARTAQHPDAQIVLRLTPSHTNLWGSSVREMGHALGLVYEHQRPDRDTANLCFPSNSTAPEHVVVNGKRMNTPYDQNSVMNFCRDSENDGFVDADYRLSVLDKAGIRLLYGHPGSSASRTWDAAFVTSFGGPGTISLSSGYSFNSQGATNTATRVGTGDYRVTLPRLDAGGGTLQVTSFFGGSKRCKALSWNTVIGGLQAAVRCFNPNGTPADSQFTMSYVRRSGTMPNGGGYAYANQPSSLSYNPPADFSWNSSGQAITITRPAGTAGAGIYTVRFAGQSFGQSTVQVTAMGSGTNYCKVNGWFTETVGVRCFTSSGTPSDTQFTLLVSPQSPVGAPSFAHASADQPNNANQYVPAVHNETFQKNVIHGSTDAVGRVVVARQFSGASTGAYRVTFNGMRLDTNRGDGKANVQVSADGTNSNYCNVDNFGGTTSHGWATINCYTASGTLVNTPFTVSFNSLYTANQPQILARSFFGAEVFQRGAIDNDWVYFPESQDNGIVRRARRNGGIDTGSGPPQEALAFGQAFPVNVAINSTDVFWNNEATNAGGLMKIAKTGGTPQVLWQNTSGIVEYVAANSTHVFFSHQGFGGLWTIYKIGVNGGPATALATNQDIVGGLALDSANLYFTTHHNITQAGTVKKVGINGGALVTLATGEYRPWSPILHNGNLYWANTSIGQTRRMSTSGGTPVTVANVASDTFAVDSNYVYIDSFDFTTGLSAIERIAINGGARATLSAGHNGATIVATDSTHVYFWGGPYALLKAPKQP
jgi:hypothetical protein